MMLGFFLYTFLVLATGILIGVAWAAGQMDR